MPYNTTDTIKGRLAGILKQASAALPTYWDNIVSDSRTRAYNEIVSKLTDRGFTIAQIDTWDRRTEFELDIALFWCLVSGAGLAAYDDKFLKLFDRRLELDTVNLTADDVPISTASVGRIGIGYLNDDRSEFKRQVAADGTLDEVAW